MANTPNRNYPKPVDSRELAEDVTTLQQFADLADTDVAQLFVLVLARSPLGHTHAMSEIEGLVTALAGKAALNHTHSFDDLTDVDGMAAATIGQIPYKTPAGWTAGDPAGVLGNHSHTIEQVTGLQTALDGKAAVVHVHTIAQVTGLQTALNAKADSSSLGTAAAKNVGTTAEIRAATVDKVATGDNVLSAMSWTALVDGASISIDHSGGVNRTVTLAGNRTVDNPTNAKVGWPLNIAVKQDATGSRTLSWGANFSFGIAGPPVLSTAAGAEDLLCFVCRSANKFAFVGSRMGI